MNIQQLLDLTQNFSQEILIFLVIVPLLSWMLVFVHGKKNGEKNPWRYIYSILIYLSGVPGMFSLVLTGYALFFTHESLLQVNMLVYLLPIVSMVVAFFMMKRHLDLEKIPGFDRLSGLMVMIGVSFVLALVVMKLRIFVFFGGSIFMLFALAAGAFALLKWGAFSFFRKSDETKRKIPLR